MWGYKVQRETSIIYTQYGAIESPETIIPLRNLDSRSWFIGYFLTEGGKIDEVIPEELIDLNCRFKITHQYWSASYSPARFPEWRYDTSSAPFIKPGNMIEIEISGPIDFDFQWRQPSSNRTETIDRVMPEYFEFTEQMNYLPFFIELENETSIQEIAVFINGECKGAVVVNDPDGEDIISQINVYLLEEPDENWEEEIEIQLFYGNREGSRVVKEYAVLNDSDNAFYKSQLKLKDLRNKDCVDISLRGDDIDSEAPQNLRFKLNNFPNPFNPVTTIFYSIPETDHAKLEIFNIKGQKVKTLFDGIKESGEHSIKWNGTDESKKKVSTGYYLYKLTSGKKTAARKMLLLK